MTMIAWDISLITILNRNVISFLQPHMRVTTNVTKYIKPVVVSQEGWHVTVTRNVSGHFSILERDKLGTCDHSHNISVNSLTLCHRWKQDFWNKHKTKILFLITCFINSKYVNTYVHDFWWFPKVTSGNPDSLSALGIVAPTPDLASVTKCQTMMMTSSELDNTRLQSWRWKFDLTRIVPCKHVTLTHLSSFASTPGPNWGTTKFLSSCDKWLNRVVGPSSSFTNWRNSSLSGFHSWRWWFTEGRVDLKRSNLIEIPTDDGKINW